MENVVVRRETEEPNVIDARKFPVMRTLARLHECDGETLCGGIDASETDVHDILTEMVSKEEVEASLRQLSGGKRSERFALTVKGWGEYMRILSSIYEL